MVTLDSFINGINSIYEALLKKQIKYCDFASAWNCIGLIYDKNGGNSSRSLEDIDRQIELIKANGIKKAQVVLTLGFNQNTKKLYIAGSSDNYNKVDYLINKLEENGIELLLLKIHYNAVLNEGETNKEWVETVLGSYTSFLELYKNKVLETANKYKNKFKRIIPINEQKRGFYNEFEYENICLELIRSLKNLGYKVSLSPMGYNDFVTINKNIKDSLDFLSCNIYPNCGDKGINTTISDMVNSFINYNDIDAFIYYCKTNYPEKEIWLTETGCCDNQLSLTDPGNPLTANDNKCDYDGELQRKYIKALLTLYGNKIDVICYFWELRGNKTKDIFIQ